MSKKYDERSVITSLARIGVKVNSVNHHILLNKQIGIHQFGKIDYLVHHCGYVCTKDNNVLENGSDVKAVNHVDKQTKRESKHQLKNKRK